MGLALRANPFSNGSVSKLTSPAALKLQLASVLAALVLPTGAMMPIHCSAQTTSDQLPAEIVTQDANGVDLTSHTLTISFPLIRFGGGTRLKADFQLNEPRYSFGNTPVSGGQVFLDTAGSAMATGTDPLSGGGVQVNNPAGSIYYGMSTANGIARWEIGGWGTHNSNGTTSYAKGRGSRQFVPFYDLTTTDSSGGHPVIGVFNEDGDYSIFDNTFHWHDGETWRYYYYNPPGCNTKYLRAVVSNAGYAVQYSYVNEACPTSGGSGFGAPKSVIGINLAHQYCNFSGGAICVADANATSKATFIYNSSDGTVLVTLPNGEQKKFTFTYSSGAWLPFVSNVSIPGTARSISYTYGAMGQCIDQIAVKTAVKDGRTWTYEQDGWDNSDRVCVGAVIDRIDPAGNRVKAFTPENDGGPGASTYQGADSRGYSTYIDELSRSWEQFAGAGITALPEGDSYLLVYDNRRNISSITAVPKSGTGQNVLIYSASFPPDCNNPIVCNKPAYTRDANNNQTDYTYDQMHGGTLSMLGPRPSAGAPRPLKLFTYTQKTAYVKNASGALVSTGESIWLPLTETQCQTVANGNSPVCDSSAQSVVTTYFYGANGTADDLLLHGIELTSGGITLRTCYTYDEWGRRVSETKPPANLASCS